MPYPEYKISLQIISNETKTTQRIISRDAAFKPGPGVKTKLRRYITWLDILENKASRDKADQPNEALWGELMECVRQIHRDYVYEYLDDRIYEIAKRITHRDLFF